MSLTKQLEEKDKTIKELQTGQVEKQDFISTIFSILKLNGGLYNSNYDRCLERLTKLVAFEDFNQGRINESIGLLREENNKLWFMVRTITKDPTLLENFKKVGEGQVMVFPQTPFDDPNRRY